MNKLFILPLSFIFISIVSSCKEDTIENKKEFKEIVNSSENDMDTRFGKFTPKSNVYDPDFNSYTLIDNNYENLATQIPINLNVDVDDNEKARLEIESLDIAACILQVLHSNEYDLGQTSVVDSICAYNSNGKPVFIDYLKTLRYTVPNYVIYGLDINKSEINLIDLNKSFLAENGVVKKDIIDKNKLDKNKKYYLEIYDFQVHHYNDGLNKLHFSIISCEDGKRIIFSSSSTNELVQF